MRRRVERAPLVLHLEEYGSGVPTEAHQDWLGAAPREGVEYDVDDGLVEAEIETIAHFGPDALFPGKLGHPGVELLQAAEVTLEMELVFRLRPRPRVRP
jgi:hypothetical protein